MVITNQIVIEKAKELGFELIGFAKAEPLINETLKLQEWLDLGYQSGMNYMNRSLDKRKDVTQILPEAKSVISLAMNYYTNHKHGNRKEYGKISRYAWGKDYHLIIWEKLELLEEYLQRIDPDIKCISYVDTGPVMDKAWAVRSGIGWLGKHSNVINREIGSWFFLATLITNYNFDYSKIIPDHCGTCRACIDACPTGAIVEEYVVNGEKCISYQTIENKGEIDKELKGQFDKWLFGCDICQDVCPWNHKFSTLTGEKEFEPLNGIELNLNEILNYDETEFKTKFETSPVKRAKLIGIKRNAKFLLNSG